jgi:hypothetical protein
MVLSLAAFSLAKLSRAASASSAKNVLAHELLDQSAWRQVGQRRRAAARRSECAEVDGQDRLSDDAQCRPRESTLSARAKRSSTKPE